MQTALGLVIGPPVIGGFTYILQHTGPYVPLYLWAFFFVLQIFFLTVRLLPTLLFKYYRGWWRAEVPEHGVHPWQVYPLFIAPLFNKFSPLDAGSLR